MQPHTSWKSTKNVKPNIYLKMFGFYIRVCIGNLYAIHQDTKSTWYSWWHKNVWIFISTNSMLTNTHNTRLWLHNKRQWLNTTTTTTSLSHMRTTHWRAAGRIAQRYPQRTPRVAVILIWTIPHTITYRYCYKSCCPIAAGVSWTMLCFPGDKQSWVILNQHSLMFCFFLAN